MAIAASVSRNFSLIIILLFAQLTARMIWIAAVVVAGKVGLIPAAVKVFGSHVVKI
jgi:ketopantoate hydroxymethyltransferase